MLPCFTVLGHGANRLGSPTQSDGAGSVSLESRSATLLGKELTDFSIFSWIIFIFWNENQFLPVFSSVCSCLVEDLRGKSHSAAQESEIRSDTLTFIFVAIGGWVALVTVVFPEVGLCVLREAVGSHIRFRIDWQGCARWGYIGTYSMNAGLIWFLSEMSKAGKADLLHREVFALFSKWNFFATRNLKFGIGIQFSSVLLNSIVK